MWLENIRNSNDHNRFFEGHIPPVSNEQLKTPPVNQTLITQHLKKYLKLS